MMRRFSKRVSSLFMRRNPALKADILRLFQS
jgi:hypothetical protein